MSQIDFIKQYAPDLSKEAEDHAYKGSDDFVKNYAATTTNRDHISKLLNHRLFYARVAAASNPNASDEQIDFAIKHDHPKMRAAAASNTSAKEHHIDIALNDYSQYGSAVRVAAAKNPNANPRQINDALSDRFSAVRVSAAENTNIKSQELFRALNDFEEKSSHKVRAAAARNPNVTKEHLDKALTDPDDRVVESATQNPRYREFFPNGHG